MERQLTSIASTVPQREASVADQDHSQRRNKPTTLAADAPLFVVINSASGKNKLDEVKEAIVAQLHAAKREFRVYVVKNPRDIQSISRSAVEQAQASRGCVVVAGGDGTINTVANEAYRSDCALGVIPLGTFNYTGRTYGIPSDPGEAIAALLNAEPTDIQAGLVNDRLFLVNAGVGFHSHLLTQREKHKAQLGRSRAVALFSAIVSLADLPARLTLDIEHDSVRETKTMAALFVGNNVLQLKQTGLLDAEGMPTQRLMGVALEPVTALQMLKLGYHAAVSKLAEDEHVHNFPFHHMTVTRPGWRPARLRVALDGEVIWMKCPITFRVAPRPLRLLLPNNPNDTSQPRDAV